MSESPAGTLGLFAFVAIAVAAPLATAAAWWLERSGRRTSFGEAMATVGTAAVGVLLAGGVAVGAVAGPVTSLVAVATVGAAMLALAGFPLCIGRALVARWTDLDPDDALRYAALGWPVALAAALVGFFLPGTGYANVTFLPGSAAAAALAALFLVVTFGPGVVGVGWYRLR